MVEYAQTNVCEEKLRSRLLYIPDLLQNQLQVRSVRAATSDEMDRGIDWSKQFKTAFTDIAF